MVASDTGSEMEGERMIEAGPTIGAIRDAADRLMGHAVRTPLLRHPAVDARAGCAVYMKAENLQRTGSFKFRGAFNAISRLDPSQARQGIYACSSGNHAQGVAAAAALFGYSATIVMPEDAPRVKKERTRSLGATIVEYDRYRQDRDEVLAAEAAGRAVVHPYDDMDVVSGQGTVGLEAADDCDRLDVTPVALLCCAGGGGLAAGCFTALRDRFPRLRLHTCEPKDYDDQARSIEAGHRVFVRPDQPTICDAIATPTPGRIAFACYGAVASTGLVVTDEEAVEAVAFAYHHLRLVLEPGGAVALAAALRGGVASADEAILITLSGGNLDRAVLDMALDRHPR